MFKRLRLTKKFWMILAIVLGVICFVTVGTNYEKEISHIGKKQEQIFVDVLDDFDEKSIDEGDSLANATYVLADYEDLEGYEIVKIGLPVKALADYTKDCSFTIYLVEGDHHGGWTEIDDFELTIEADTYKKNTVGEWVYFKVSIEIEKNQTLAFGSAEDTITLAYNSTEGTNFNYYTDPFGTPTISKSALYIDVYGYELR